LERVDTIPLWANHSFSSWITNVMSTVFPADESLCHWQAAASSIDRINRTRHRRNKSVQSHRILIIGDGVWLDLNWSICSEGQAWFSTHVPGQRPQMPVGHERGMSCSWCPSATDLSKTVNWQAWEEAIPIDTLKPQKSLTFWTNWNDWADALKDSSLNLCFSLRFREDIWRTIPILINMKRRSIIDWDSELIVVDQCRSKASNTFR
jgi:hypothetical protein